MTSPVDQQGQSQGADRGGHRGQAGPQPEADPGQPEADPGQPGAERTQPGGEPEGGWPWPLSAFVRSVGLQPKQVTGTLVTGWADLGPDHHTPQGVVHGGVYATLVETAASIGASTAVADRGQYAVGVHNATDFLRPHVAGRVNVTAEPIQQGRVQQLWQVRIEREEDGALLAAGQLRLQNVPAR